MATYYECDGTTRRAMTVTASVGSQTFYRQYTNGAGTIITESYKKMTISCNPAPISAGGLTVYYTYQTSAVDGTGSPVNWYNGSKPIDISQGQSQLIVDVPIEIEYCYNDGYDGEYPIYNEEI